MYWHHFHSVKCLLLTWRRKMFPWHRFSVFQFSFCNVICWDVGQTWPSVCLLYIVYCLLTADLENYDYCIRFTACCKTLVYIILSCVLLKNSSYCLTPHFLFADHLIWCVKWNSKWLCSCFRMTHSRSLPLNRKVSSWSLVATLCFEVLRDITTS